MSLLITKSYIYLFLLVILCFHFQITSSSCQYLNYCNGHGRCNQYGVCNCYDGWGSTNDVSAFKAADCSARVCPSGKEWVGLAYTNSTGHNVLKECSNAGICDRKSGTCSCFTGFQGSACQHRSCINDCSGHGLCKSMVRLAKATNAEPVSNGTNYGFVPELRVWDYEMVSGCACDSSWTVGIGPKQVQSAEWFGPDCSLRRCPSGDNPRTYINELNGYNRSCSHDLVQNTTLGEVGNFCHIDCSNLGICDYTTGLCSCFKGYYGSACNLFEGVKEENATSLNVDKPFIAVGITDDF